jgi:ketosteroid isomerase-like protein
LQFGFRIRAQAGLAPAGKRDFHNGNDRALSPLLFASKSGKMAGSIGTKKAARGIDMTRAEVDQLIRTVYAARVAGDIDAIMSMMAPDVHFALAGDPTASPVAGRLVGIDKLRPQLAGLIKDFKFNRYDITTLVVEGSTAAVRGKANITSALTGATVDMELADFIEVKDGRIASFVQFCDTAMVARLSARP